MGNRISSKPGSISYSFNAQLSSPNHPTHSGALHAPPAVPDNYGFYWAPWTAGQMCPNSAIEGGYDVDGAPIFVGRVLHNQELIPGKVIPHKNIAFFPYGGQEISYDNCEVLCQQIFHWVGSSHGNVPQGAVPAGYTSSGETLYIARAFHEGSHCVGKLHPSHRTCYVPFGGKEHSHSTDYEVLVQTDFYQY